MPYEFPTTPQTLFLSSSLYILLMGDIVPIINSRALGRSENLGAGKISNTRSFDGTDFSFNSRGG